MLFSVLLLLPTVSFSVLSNAVSESPGIHLLLHRRGGRLSDHEPANTTRLVSLVDLIEVRWNRTGRRIQNNKLIREWRSDDNSHIPDVSLYSLVGGQGQWYTTLHIGDSPQFIEFDLDMTGPDSYMVLTTSGKGTKFDTFASKSFVEVGAGVQSSCVFCRDQFRLGGGHQHDLEIALCSPPKSSSSTLENSGAIFGLAPPSYLSRLHSPSTLKQLQAKQPELKDIWSVTILDHDTGVLSLGGTLLREVEKIKTQLQIELANFGNPVATSDWVAQQVDNALDLSLPPDVPDLQQFKWVDVHSAGGWWTALMAGVWIDGAKILKNQPILFDIQCPFIIAPESAAKQVYGSFGGTKQMTPPDDQFFSFPCANPPKIAFEIAGWNFPSMQGRGPPSDALFGPVGGRFSLGHVGNGSGYCIGIVVAKKHDSRQSQANHGLENTWIMGEPFFRGMGVVFDTDHRRIGFRSY